MCNVIEDMFAAATSNTFDVPLRMLTLTVAYLDRVTTLYVPDNESVGEWDS